MTSLKILAILFSLEAPVAGSLVIPAGQNGPHSLEIMRTCSDPRYLRPDAPRRCHVFTGRVFETHAACEAIIASGVFGLDLNVIAEDLVCVPIGDQNPRHTINTVDPN